MKNELDMDLGRLFAEKSEPPQGEIFVKRVSKRIMLRRYSHRVMQILIAFAGATILAVLTPWLINLTGYIALGSNLLANSALALILSPVGWAIGSGVGLSLFLKTRS